MLKYGVHWIEIKAEKGEAAQDHDHTPNRGELKAPDCCKGKQSLWERFDGGTPMVAYYNHPAEGGTDVSPVEVAVAV